MVTVLHLECDDPDHTFLTPQELADSLPSVPLSRLSAWRRTGGGPDFVKFGKSVAYKVSDINVWIKRSTHSTTGDRPTRVRSAR